jgi:hypothetical protein
LVGWVKKDREWQWLVLRLRRSQGARLAAFKESQFEFNVGTAGQ